MSSPAGCLCVILIVAVALRVSLGQQLAVNSWYVRFKKPVCTGEAAEVAKRNGFSYVGPLFSSNISTEHHFTHKAVPDAATWQSRGPTLRLRNDDLVDFTMQEQGFVRVKRGYRQGLMSRLVTGLSRVGSKTKKVFHPPTDPLYLKQWYLKNTGQAGGNAGLDINVEAAWAQGYTGKNVTAGVLDDGLDYMHPDFVDNYNAEVSYDFTSNDPYPYPRWTEDGFNSHGTRCAGEIAAARDGKNAVGVAYDSKIAGVRVLDQPFMNDLLEARAIGHRQDAISIYSASWGPTDNGKTLDGPRRFTQRAMVKGINEGRQGKGSIYVWAGGDGGWNDDCNCDGFVVSMWTISINAATNDGRKASYDESCSSIMASTFSSGNFVSPESFVATTDLFGRTTTGFSGTSASTPQAAGVYALVLEANSELTWRDLQHITVLTSKQRQVRDPKGRHLWNANGVGLMFNHLFGFGVLDAGELVTLASKWRKLPDRHHCSTGLQVVNRTFDAENPLRIVINVTGCTGTNDEVNFLEHAQAVITVKAPRRGDITMFLTSPMNSRSAILSRRPNDDDFRIGFRRWPFMTVQTWGENPIGSWILEVKLESKDPQSQGILSEIKLVMHGTREQPYAGQNDKDGDHPQLAAVRNAHKSSRFNQPSSL